MDRELRAQPDASPRHRAASPGNALRRRLTRNRASEENGQAFVEFAIALPVLLALILAIVDFGITLNHWETLTDAVRAGGRAAATCRFGGSASAAFSAAATDLPGVVVPGNPTCPASPGGPISYSASYPYKIRVFGLSVYSGNLTATSTERVE